MKRQRPQWQSVCTMLSLVIWGMVMCASGEAYEGDLGRNLGDLTVPPVLQPIPQPDETNVTSAPTIIDGGCTTGENGDGCAPAASPVLDDGTTYYPSVKDFFTPSPSQIDVEPTEPPTETPPTDAATPQPVELQTPQPSLPETPQPIDQETPQPVDTEPPFPPEPQTSQPFEPPTSAPVQTTEPPVQTTEPPVQTTEPPVATPVLPTPELTPAPISKPTLFPLTRPPTSTNVEVPIEPFVLTLGFNEPQTGTAMDLEVLTSEIESIVGNYLFDSLTAQNTNENVVLEAVQLTATPELRRRADNVFDGKRRLRALQAQVVNFQISGNAVYNVAEGANVTPEQLEQDTNNEVAATMSDPVSLDEITQQFQDNPESDALRNTAAVTAKVEAPPDSNGSDKPTTVATVFGFVLAGLGAIGLCMYAWAFFKKRRKRQLQRKRERERGLGDSFNNTRVNTTASMGSSMNMGSSINRSRSSPASKMMVLPPTEFEDDSSSEADSSPAVDESSSAAMSAPEASGSVSSASDPYAGIASDSSSKSDFTRELELAASLDRRSWIETQQQRSAMGQDSRDRGPIQYPSQYEVEGIEAQHVSGDGVAAVGIATAGVAVAAAAVAAKSYPYGDEDSDNLPVDFSQVQDSDGEDLFTESEEGVEWTEEGDWSPYDGYGQQKVPVGGAKGDSMTNSRSSERQSDRPSWMKSWSSIDSFRERRKPAKDPNAYLKSWSSIDTARETDSRRTLLGSLAEDSEIEEEELFVRAAARAVEMETLESRAVFEDSRTSPPTVSISSAGTSNAVRMSPATSAATEVVLREKVVVEENDADADADSILTEDIVKEVSRLARFVKKYDKKRERKLLKDRERSEKAALATKDSQSHPSTSIGYDAMSDSASALRKGRVDISPRRERAALSNPVEGSDESDSSERSWSTTSNANGAFDDDEESSPVVDDSEIDVSDDSESDEDISESASDMSRLGITPFSVQKVVGRPKNANPAKLSNTTDASAPETSRPPAAKRPFKSRGLPPLSSTPGSPDEDSPEKTPKPVKNIKTSMRGVSSSQQQRYSQKNEQDTSIKQSRKKGLTEDVLHELADGDGPAGVTTPYQQPKGALAVLRKNQAILDTASSHFTDGVTSSQYEQAIKVGMARQDEQRRAYLARNSFTKQAHRIPKDPPAKTSESASLQATDEKRSPPGWESKEPSVDESRVPPAQSSPKEELRKQSAARESTSEERVPWSKPAAPQKVPEPQTSSSQPPRRWKPPPKTTSQPATGAPTSFAAKSGNKRAAPQTPTAEETAPAQMSPAMKSPPRRKSKRGSAFNNVISMFEQKPKNPIYPATDGWQYNGASR